MLTSISLVMFSHDEFAFLRFWDERFVFECDEKSNELRLQIIDHRKTNKRTGSNYGKFNHYFLLTLTTYD